MTRPVEPSTPASRHPERSHRGRLSARDELLAEAERLAALHAYDVLDAPADAELDDVVHTAAMVAGVSNATLNLIDEHRQCQLTTVGFEGSDSARSDSMCALHFTDGNVVHVPDASVDERYRTNPWVDGRLARVRLYASAPLISPRGHALGSLCVFDTEPGRLSAAQLDGLVRLARVVVALFERRRQARLAESYAEEARQHAVHVRGQAVQVQQLAAREAEQRLLLAAAGEAFLAVDEDQRTTSRTTSRTPSRTTSRTPSRTSPPTS